MLMKNKNILFSFWAIMLAFLLSGCHLVILEPKGLIASIEKNIIITSVVLMLLVVIPVIVLTLTFAWQYRETNTKAAYTPNWSHNIWLEIIWWSIPCVIIVILGTITYISSHTLDPYRPISSTAKPINIQVIALRWKWLFIYPEQDIATINYVHFPVDAPVQFTISSDGPMNSFQIPALGSQIYAMAGMQTKLNLIANEKGDYQGLSTHFSGDGFSEMKFIAHIGTQDEFDQWVKITKASSTHLTLQTFNELTRPNTVHSPLYFSAVGKQIFNMVVMKSMMPISFEDMAKCDEKTIIAMKNRNYKGIGYAQ